ncbi:MAG: methyl-accepting chemotaxis protein [Holophagales bacterium]|jgi:methyl-accepting chemotaxis protein|nr:methyl-accepting chemotaxis protein [Holophagales bacterium]
MDWYKNLRLRSKLILGFIATAILTVIVGWQGMSAARTMSAGSDKLYREGVKGVRATGQITKHFGEMRQRLRDLMILTNPDAQRKNKRQYDDNREAIYRHYSELREITKNNPDLARLVSKTSGTFEDWIKTVDKAADLAVAGKIQDAVQHMSVTAVDINSRFLGELEELAAAMDNVAANIDKHNRLVKSRVAMMITAITLTVFGASILLGITISNVVAGALDRISVIIQRVAMGDLTAHFVVESKDEIGVMAVRLEKMVVQIWEFINRVNQSLSVVAGAAAELSASADGMSSSIEQISHSAQTQKSTSEKIVAAMAELSASVDEASLRAQGSLAQLDAALQRNSTGELAGDALDEITQATARIAEAIGVIQETAHRANLLIRNVSFGAARADEHGRWVVSAAEEARKLTERSAASAKEIVRHNIELLDSAERGGETVNTTVELLRNIKDGLDQLTTRKNYPESSAKKEKGSAKETTIETATTQISATTGNVTHAATELAHLASELQAEIRQFKLINKVD